MVRFIEALEKGHAFALWHKEKHGAPNSLAFIADVDRAVKKWEKDGWSQLERSIMVHYASAALAYDLAGGPEGRGMWSERAGNLGFTDMNIVGRFTVASEGEAPDG